MRPSCCWPRPSRLCQPGQAGHPRLSRNASGEAVHLTTDMMQGYCDGLICLSGGPRGPIGFALKEDRRDLAEARC